MYHQISGCNILSFRKNKETKRISVQIFKNFKKAIVYIVKNV